MDAVKHCLILAENYQRPYVKYCFPSKKEIIKDFHKYKNSDFADHTKIIHNIREIYIKNDLCSATCRLHTSDEIKTQAAHMSDNDILICLLKSLLSAFSFGIMSNSGEYKRIYSSTGISVRDKHISIEKVLNAVIEDIVMVLN